MEESTSKEKVLKNVRNALISKTDMPYPHQEPYPGVYQTSEESLDVGFARAFTNVAGRFVYCEDKDDFISSMKIVLENLNKKYVYCLDEEIRTMLNDTGLEIRDMDEDFEKADLGITTCEFLIARLGSVMVSSKQTAGRRLNVFPEIHIVIAYPDQFVPDLSDALKAIQLKYEGDLPSLISVITGPSRTADIEKTLIMGAHGPKNLFVFLVEDIN